MFVKSFKDDFFRIIQGCRVQIFCAIDVDALCACAVYCHICKINGLLYSISPVVSLEDLKTKYKGTPDEVKAFILINCGGCIDIMSLFELDEVEEFDKVFFINDCHRPLDVNNIYNSKHVRLLVDNDDVGEFPDFNDVFREDMYTDYLAHDFDEDAELEHDSLEINDNDIRNPSTYAERLGKKRDLDIWLRRREDILFKYSEFSYYGQCAAFLAFKIAWHLSIDSSELLWIVSIAVADQYINSKVERSQILDQSSQLLSHCSRYQQQQQAQHKSTSGSFTAKSIVNCCRVTFESETFVLPLLEHWSTYDCLRTALPTACKFHSWKGEHGLRRLRGFLADSGISLRCSKQQFNNMLADYDNPAEIKETLLSNCVKYGLDRESMVTPAFRMRYGYTFNMTNIDAALSLQCLLADGVCTSRKQVLSDSISIVEQQRRRKTENCDDPIEILFASCRSSFLSALRALDVSNQSDTLLLGVDRCKSFVEAQFRAVAATLNGGTDVRKIGPLLVVTWTGAARDAEMASWLSHPATAASYANYLLTCFAAHKHDRRASTLPLLAMFTVFDPTLSGTRSEEVNKSDFTSGHNENEPSEEGIGGTVDQRKADGHHGLMLCVGMPPLEYDAGKNCFGKAFEFAADDVGVTFVGFGLNTVLIKADDQRRFVEKIVSLLS